MTPAQLIKHYGTIEDAAYKLRYTQQTIRNWLAAESIPHKSQIIVEYMTGGVLKADKVRR